MITNVIFATSANMVNDLNVLNAVTLENATENGLHVVTSWQMDDRKTARRQMYDICRLLRGEKINGKTTVPNEITTACNGLKLDKTNTDFCTNKKSGDGILTIDTGTFHGYLFRSDIKPVKTDKTDGKTDKKTATKTAKTTDKTETAAHEYKCKNTAANRSILTNNGIIYTDGGDFLTYTTDAKTAKTLKIKTVK